MKKGAKELYVDIEKKIHHNKMDDFVLISSIKLKDNHGGKDIYTTFDRSLISPDSFEDLVSLVKKKK